VNIKEKTINIVNSLSGWDHQIDNLKKEKASIARVSTGIKNQLKRKAHHFTADEKDTLNEAMRVLNGLSDAYSRAVPLLTRKCEENEKERKVSEEKEISALMMKIYDELDGNKKKELALVKKIAEIAERHKDDFLFWEHSTTQILKQLEKDLVDLNIKSDLSEVKRVSLILLKDCFTKGSAGCREFESAFYRLRFNENTKDDESMGL